MSTLVGIVTRSKLKEVDERSIIRVAFRRNHSIGQCPIFEGRRNDFCEADIVEIGIGLRAAIQLDDADIQFFIVIDGSGEAGNFDIGKFSRGQIGG